MCRIAHFIFPFIPIATLHSSRRLQVLVRSLEDPSSVYIRLLEREYHQDACEESNSHYQEAFGRRARSCLLPRYVAAYTIHNRLETALGYLESQSQALADLCPIDMVKEAIISVSPLSPAHHDRLAPVMSVAVTRLSPQRSVSISRSLRGSYCYREVANAFLPFYSSKNAMAAGMRLLSRSSVALIPRSLGSALKHPH